jgi:two-component system, chemotaxis family, chemotaxis protein CheY
MSRSELRFLIVDDFETMRALISTELIALGYFDIQEAENGKSAYALIEAGLDQNKPIDLVFCDWNMPEMTGLELLQKIKADPRFANLPFVMVTAEAEMKSVVSAVEAGVTDYLVKPVTREALNKKINKVLQKIGK